MAVSDVQGKRARRAAGITVAIVVLIVLACLVAQRHGQDTVQDGVSVGGSYVGSMWREMIAGGDVSTVLESEGFVTVDGTVDTGMDAADAEGEGDGVAGEGEDAVPAWFSEEVVDLGAYGQVTATADWSVVGFSAEEEWQETCATLSECLNQVGWTSCSSGIDGVVTFVKEGGRCSWMLMSCTSMGETTSVVLRIQHT